VYDFDADEGDTERVLEGGRERGRESKGEREREKGTCESHDAPKP
jgi:hypothetical protein